MSLGAKLRSLADGFAETAPPAALAAIRQAIGGLVASGAADDALKAGDRMPGFELQDPDGRSVNSSELLQKGPLVVHFYRGVW